LTPRELLKIAGIVSTKCLKNCQIDGILVSVVSLWIEKKSANPLKKIGLNCESGGGFTSIKKALASKEKEACGLTVLR
jgi:hypothetical protein